MLQIKQKKSTAGYIIYRNNSKKIAWSGSLKLICENVGLSYKRVITSIRMSDQYVDDDITIIRKNEDYFRSQCKKAGLPLTEDKIHGSWIQTTNAETWDKTDYKFNAIREALNHV
jgi:hypothetical protein